MPDSPPTKSREEIVGLLRTLLPELNRDYGVRSLSLFGSRVRGAEHRDSDVDILVEFDRTPGFFRFVELEDHLSRQVGVPVDLVMKTALRKKIGQRVIAEAIRV